MESVDKPKKVLATGRTVRQELDHKLRGWEQFWVDIAAAYPTRITIICTALCLAIVVGAWLLFVATGNRRLLTGEELDRGHKAFDAIKAADDTAENFTTPALRRTAISQAQTQLNDFQQYARKQEELHAGTILNYYLDEVKQLPDRDRDCAKAMMTAQQAGIKAPDGVVTDTLQVAETGELTCMSGRSQAVAIKNTCKEEAQSYLTPNHQPPVDSCLFRHMTQGVYLAQ